MNWICRFCGHDRYELAYPPARRWECRRCHRIVEEASTVSAEHEQVVR